MRLLFEPLALREMRLSNRVVMPPMVTNYASEEGAVTKRLVDYYEARARGGAGLIIVEMTSPHPAGKGFPCMLGVYNDKFIPGLKELSRSIQSFGACAALQIGHAGRQTSSSITGHRVLAPSPIPSKGTMEIPEELSLEEIQEITESFGQAALRARRAGFDAIELHGTHGYLLNGFLSPYTNKRRDLYGGSFENRLRFPLEVIREVRGKVGEDFPIIFRLCGNEYIEGDEGITPDLAKQIAPRLIEAGIDGVHVTGGIGETRDHLVQPLYYREQYHVYLAEAIKQAIGDAPVITAGSIRDPDSAEKILQEGKADLIAMGRALLADPLFPKKAKTGRSGQIRRCIRCNECVSHLRSGYRILCTVNYDLGREADSQVYPAEKQKKILVVGSGPGGMEAARVLSLRGHDVTLCEKDGFLGGLIHLAAAPPWKKDLLDLVHWLEDQLEKSGVKTHLNTEVDRDFIERIAPDVLVMATGAVPHRPRIPGAESAMTAMDVLRGGAVGETVLVCGGGLIGCETAWYLAEQERKVTIVEMLPDIVPDVEIAARSVILKQLRRYDVRVITKVKMEKVLPGQGAFGIDRNWNQVEIKADTVVLATGLVPNRALYDQVKESRETVLLGDAKKPRRIIDAMHEANHLARFQI